MVISLEIATLQITIVTLAHNSSTLYIYLFN